MKKKIVILLVVFSLIAVAGGTYLAYSFERRLSDFNSIILLHHVENLREHLLHYIRKVEIGLYTQETMHAESSAAIENHIIDLERSIAGCYACHHTPGVVDRLDDVRQQIGQYKDEISAVLAIPAVNSSVRKGHHINPHIVGDSLIGKVENMVVSTSEKLREQTEDSLRKAHGMKTVMIGVIAAGPVIMIVFAVTVMGGVGAPINVLLRAARILKTGDLRHRITGLKDEFGELALAFNDMAESLHITMRAIEESENRYRLLFETAADGIFILEVEGERRGKILKSNQAAADMHGFTVQELEEMNILDLDLPQDPAAMSQRMARIYQGEWIKFETMHRRKDGSVFPVEVSAGLLIANEQKFVLAMDRDLTDRKRVEKELQRSERIRVAGELATGLAHEIKNPLAGIMVAMEVLAEESSLSKEDRDVLSRVIMEIKRIECLMKGVLDFARPPRPQFVNTDVNSVLETVAALVLKERSRLRDQAHEIHLSREFDKNLPEIMADPMHLKQIFMNLMLNAADAMPEGGTITIRTSFDPGANSLLVELEDTGRGIDSDFMAKVFSPFFTTKAKGTGLGLSITRRLVEEHGGSINIKNNPQGGVTCSITIPVRQVEGAVSA